MKRTIRLVIGFGIIVGFVAVGVYLLHPSLPDTKEGAQIESPTRIPTIALPPPRPLAQGRQVYTVSRGNGSKGPDMREVAIDPFDPKKGEQQTVEVKVNHPVPVVSMSVTLLTDHRKKTYPMKKVEGSSTQGVWKGSWKTEDAHDYIYTAIVEAKDVSESSRVELAFR